MRPIILFLRYNAKSPESLHKLESLESFLVRREMPNGSQFNYPPPT